MKVAVEDDRKCNVENGNWHGHVMLQTYLNPLPNYPIANQIVKRQLIATWKS